MASGTNFEIFRWEGTRSTHLQKTSLWTVLVDVSLPVLAKMSALVETLRLGESFKLVHQPLCQFILVSGQVNVVVTCSRDKILVSALFVALWT